MNLSDDGPCDPLVALVNVELNADEILFDLDDDQTLKELDAAHGELDAEARALRAGGEVSDYNYVMTTDVVDGVGHGVKLHAHIVAKSDSRDRVDIDARRAAIDDRRRHVEAQHRAEVRRYAKELRIAIAQMLTHLCVPVPVDITVTAEDVTGRIRPAPASSAPPKAQTLINQAVGEAIAQTPTPASLPGTLLSRAEASYEAERRWRQPGAGVPPMRRTGSAPRQHR